MKRKILMIINAMMIVLLFVGCGAKQQEDLVVDSDEEAISIVKDHQLFLLEKAYLSYVTDKMIDYYIDGKDMEEVLDDYAKPHNFEIASASVETSQYDCYVVNIKGTFLVDDAYGTIADLVKYDERIYVYKDKNHQNSDNDEDVEGNIKVKEVKTE